MEKKRNPFLRLSLLFLTSVALFTAGWLMKPFPLFLFAGLAPLFALADENSWSTNELALLALTVAFFAARLFRSEFLVWSIAQGIAATLPFVGYGYLRKNLRLPIGKGSIIIFWLGMEYLLLKLPLRESAVFLADGLQQSPVWLRWNHDTGYLGASAWILVCNFVLYLACSAADTRGRIVYSVLTMVVLAGPIVASYRMALNPLTRADMMAVYRHQPVLDTTYYYRGEVVPRLSAIVSGVLLAMTFLYPKTQKST
jgi:hypothetical protein